MEDSIMEQRVTELFEKLEMKPQQHQFDFVHRSLNGSVQGRFPRQGGATTVLSLCAAMQASENKNVQYICMPASHDFIHLRITKDLAYLGQDYTVKCEYSEELERDINHVITLGEGKISLRGRASDGRDIDVLILECPWAKSYPIRVALLNDAGITVLELGSGGGPQWDDHPIMMKWWECTILATEHIKSLKTTLSKEKFRDEFECVFTVD